MRLFIFIILLFYSCFLYSQDDSLRVKINHNVLEPDIVNPSTRVETFIEVTDSIDLFIDNIQKQFGEVEDENGKYEWNNVSVDSIGNNLSIVMVHGYWSVKATTATFKPISISKANKLKEDEKRILRIRVFLKNGKDALTSKKFEIIMVQLLEDLLNQPAEENQVEE